MSDFSIEDKSLDTFMKELDDLQRLFPKQAKQMMLRVGNKARTIIVKKARQLVKKKSGNYYKSIKRGRVWVDQVSGEYKVRTYTRAPHGHLIEKGHRIIGKDGEEKGFVEGYHVFDKATREIDAQYTDILEKEFDRMFSKL